jgi:hypothetical protein
VQLEVWVRQPDRVLCVFRDGRQEGRRILVHGDRVWLIVPGVSRAIPIGAQHRLYGGASVADLARLRFAELFTGAVEGQERIDGQTCLVLRLTPRGERSPYGPSRLWVGVADGLPRRAHLALPSGTATKELRFPAFATEDGRPVLRQLVIEHLLAAERGRTTTLEFLDYEARPLAPDLFDLPRARDPR